MVNGYEIIDSHIHPGYPNIFDAVKGEEMFIDDLRRAGVDRICGSVIKRAVFESEWSDIEYCNEAAMDFQKRYPDFYYPGIQLHGSYVEESCREVEKRHAQGVRWVGELVNYAMRTGRYSSRGMMQIFEVCRDYNMTINLHNDGNISEIEPILKAFPTLNVVVAHPHEYADAKSRFEYISHFPNAYMDISGNGIQRYGMIRWAINCCGKDKLLFGSDYPINSVGMYVQGVLYERLTEAERRALFSENFRRLTGITG